MRHDIPIPSYTPSEVAMTTEPLSLPPGQQSPANAETIPGDDAMDFDAIFPAKDTMKGLEKIAVLKAGQGDTMKGLEKIAELKAGQEANIDNIANMLLRDQQQADRESAMKTLKGAEQDLLEAVEAVTFDIRGPLGQAFSRSGEAKSETYKSLRGWAARREFRAEWAKARLENVIPHKVRKTTVKERYLKHGRYMSSRKIWEEEGMDPSGFEAAKRHVMECIRRGWVLCNVMFGLIPQNKDS